MAKVIVNSIVFLRELKRMDYPARVIGDADKNKLLFGGRSLDCEIKQDFAFPFYYTSFNRLIKILELLEEQPIVVEFKDSELFNVTLHGIIV